MGLTNGHISPGMKTSVPLRKQRYTARSLAPCFFDIVNGFLIDAVAHRVKKMSGFRADQDQRVCVTYKYNRLDLVTTRFSRC